jgi:hypothetical protein
MGSMNPSKRYEHWFITKGQVWGVDSDVRKEMWRALEDIRETTGCPCPVANYSLKSNVAKYA